MPPNRPSRYRQRLGAELKALRVARGYSIRALAEEMRPDNRPGEYPHARVQRAETGELVLSDPEMLEWLRATHADEDTAARLVDHAAGARLQHEPWAALLEASESRHLNAIAAEQEAGARLNLSYQQVIVPGLAQTAAYARALVGHLDLPDLDPAQHVAGLQARQEVLHDSGHRFRFVLSRRAVLWNPDPDSVSMAGQLDRLRELDSLPNVSVSVLDDVAGPMGGRSSFTVYDEPVDGDPVVVVELEHGRVPVLDPDGVERYRRRFDLLAAAATPVAEA